MGFGDVKLMLPIGAVLGWPLVILGMFLAFFLGAIISAYLLAAGGKSLKSQIPFGTFLSAACIVVLLWGKELWAAYLSLIGF